ncbi:hypothetical protein GALMADRAFT_131408 [Galerina marginata CBS 339.88]|uniref:Uncharacterized protein n=1 Tax=Galerina marginata (strain CBS 339.88) TaxID=685588 RepID=A0A067SC33_GALM3|nr:hypothetical protein GALMADRAFT_131408 [Galerina marginata CBS 339.88]
MCSYEIVGDYYRGCQHFHGRYYTGQVISCDDKFCKTSPFHKHKTTKNCTCAEIVVEDRRVQNLFQVAFVKCRNSP